MNQKQAVFKAINDAFSKLDKPLKGKVNLGKEFPSEIREKAHESLCSMFTSERVALKPTKANKEKLSDPKLMSAYVSGLITNWVKKDPRLNGSMEVDTPEEATRKVRPKSKSAKKGKAINLSKKAA